MSPQSLAYKYLTKGGVFGDFIMKNTRYNIVKVKRKRLLEEQYLPYLQNSELDEKWILILKDHNGSEHHAIGFEWFLWKEGDENVIGKFVKVLWSKQYVSFNQSHGWVSTEKNDTKKEKQK